MKIIICQLVKQHNQLLELIQNREDKVRDMSWRWQESQKCEDWWDKTEDIQEQANELDTIIDKLKDLS